jgi:endonuclease/exonuclease/phosphatase family metal-dependent hydrolase
MPVRLQRRPPVDSTPAWTLVAWNIEKYERGVDGIAATLQPLDADVICLSEAGSYFWHRAPERETAGLEAALAGYQAVGAGELRVFSRLPVLSSREHPLTHGEEGRPLLEVVVATPAPVSVFCMHGPPSYALDRLAEGNWPAWSERRQRHAAEVQALLPQDAAAILAGDFNCPEAAPTWDHVPMHDAWQQKGSGFGWTMATGHRLDRVFTSPAVRTKSIRVVRTAASDHDALLATFTR